MVSEQRKQFADCQRIQVAKETQGEDTVLKILLERFDVVLGWYSAGALTIPLHQLPLLQQALEEMDCVDCDQCRDKCRGKIISFPLMAKEVAGE